MFSKWEVNTNVIIYFGVLGYKSQTKTVIVKVPTNLYSTNLNIGLLQRDIHQI